jgi:hypothetical protein
LERDDVGDGDLNQGEILRLVGTSRDRAMVHGQGIQPQENWPAIARVIFPLHIRREI